MQVIDLGEEIAALYGFHVAVALPGNMIMAMQTQTACLPAIRSSSR